MTRPMTSWPRIAGYCDAPFVVQDREIGVAQAAVFDGDFNILGPERSEINGFEYHRLFSCLRDPCLIIHHVAYSEPRLDWTVAGSLRLGVKVDMCIPFYG